jgi:hypothetical protein
MTDYGHGRHYELEGAAPGTEAGAPDQYLTGRAKYARVYDQGERA